jgi:hypothetical protein
MPGSGLEMEGATQQAPQPGRQFMSKIRRSGNQEIRRWETGRQRL